MKRKSEKNDRQYWLWVTRPDVWLDKNAKDASDLDPRKKDYRREEWTCHKDTKKGDLAFLWRSRKKLKEYLRSIRSKRDISPKSDIGYLMRAESDANGPREDWAYPYWCKFRPLYKFENPVTVDDFKNDLILEKSYPHKIHFVRNSFPLSKEEWDRIIRIAIQKNPDFKKFYESLHGKKIAKPGKEIATKEEKPTPGKAQDKSKERFRRKYGSGGEGAEHKKLKEWVAKNPERIGLLDVEGPPKIEYPFASGDSADILFTLGNGRYAVVEVETDIPEPGVYQALKYKVLQCAELGLDIKSPNVEGILVAWSIPDSTKELCAKYNILPVQIEL